MATDVSKPDPTGVLELIHAFRRSKVMFAAVSLGVFDALAAGPKRLQPLAKELEATADGLERLLDGCVGLKLLVFADGAYRTTPAASAYLCKQSPDRLAGYINFSNDVTWKLWDNLEDAIREGTHRWKQTFGWDGPIFANFFKTDELKREFLLGMHGMGLMSSPLVVGAFDLSRYRRMVDLGGATGHLAVAACQRYPQLRAVVFDLADAAPLANDYISAAATSDRVQFASGDFFTDPLPDGDLYAVGRIFHDWTEEKILKLAKRVFDALPTGGAFLVAEKILLDDKSGPEWAQLQNLNMLACTEGKERTLAEYEALLQRVGFGKVSGCRTTSLLDAMLAIKG